jgi:hypothetical protein
MAVRRAVVITSAVLIVLLCPSVVFANAGTPLMWLGRLHLLFGNAIIGLVEGLVLAVVFRGRPRRMIGFMILANYFSMGVGAYALPWRGVPSGSTWSTSAVDLYTAPDLLKRVAWLCFAASVVLEWPFCALGLRGTKRWLLKSIPACILAQVVSHAALVPLYRSASALSLYTAVQLDRTLSFARPVDAFVYFIAPEDGDVYRIRPDGSERTHVLKVGIRDPNARLFVREGSSGGWDLYAAWADDGDVHRLQENFTTREGLSRGKIDTPSGRESGSWQTFGSAWDLRPDSERRWRVWTGFWPADGLWADNMNTKARYQVGLETPFLAWNSRNASILPGDQVVYQLGDQIVLLDLNARKIGLITRGRGPLVLLDERP